MSDKRFKHSHASNGKTKEYNAWVNMKSRTTNKKNKEYKYYGLVGIKIEDKRWFEFINFFYDMGFRPEGFSLDRIDNSKGYYKENCRWADKKTQANNMSSNVLIKFKNKTKTMSQWADYLEIKRDTLWRRIRRVGVEKAMVRGLMRGK